MNDKIITYIMWNAYELSLLLIQLLALGALVIAYFKHSKNWR